MSSVNTIVLEGYSYLVKKKLRIMVRFLSMVLSKHLVAYGKIANQFINVIRTHNVQYVEQIILQQIKYLQ